MRYIIPYSFSQQNEFYKVYNTKKKKKRKKKDLQGEGEMNMWKSLGGAVC